MDSTTSSQNHLIPSERGVYQAPGGNLHYGDNFYGQVFAHNVGGCTTNIIHPPPKVTALALLRPSIACDALYNSGKRAEEHASTCHPDTRARILEEISQWVDGEGFPVCWLHGPAGSGKSTIAHTIAEAYERRRRLAGTFFFARKKGDREDINKLIPTLAYQIAESTPTLQQSMEDVLQKNSTLLAQTIRQKFLNLIVEPLKDVRKLDRYLIVIDGLDECAMKRGIQELIELIGGIANSRQIPLRFLLTSRPERHIEAAFKAHLNRSMALWLALEDSRDDVRTYLKTELQKIRDDFDSVLHNQPTSWPPQLDLDHLVNLSDGLFIYASTAVQYIGDGNGSPQTKLQKLLKIHKGLDPLYAQVVTDAQVSDNFHIVMGTVMYLRTSMTVRQLSWLLQLDISDIRMALDQCRSILVVPRSDDEPIRPYHASFRDYLTDQERSQDLFFAPSKYHQTLLFQCLKDITSARLNDVWPLVYSCREWRYHALLLLGECASQQSDDDIETEIKQIDLQWLEFWSLKVSVTSTPSSLTIDLPKAKPNMHQSLYKRLADSNIIFKTQHSAPREHTRQTDIVDTDIIIPVLSVFEGASTFIDVAAGQDIARTIRSMERQSDIIHPIPICYPKGPGGRVVLLYSFLFQGVSRHKNWVMHLHDWLSTFCDGKQTAGVIVLHDLKKQGIETNFESWRNPFFNNIVHAMIPWYGVPPSSGEFELREATLPAASVVVVGESRLRVANFHRTYRSAWQIIDSVVDNNSINDPPM